MVKLIIVRHGESKSNENNFFTGQTNVPLSVLGEKQAQILCDYVLKNYKIDKIYSSPLIRAYNTVKPIADKLGLEIIIKDNLKEINGGLWEERTMEYIKTNYPSDYALWHTNIGFAHCTGGESMVDVQKRGDKIIREIARENEGKTVLIGCHAGFIRAMQCIWQNLSNEKMQSIPWVANASISELVYENDRLVSSSIGYDKHLSGFLTHLAKDI